MRRGCGFWREAELGEVLRGGLGLTRFELAAGKQKLELELPGVWRFGGGSWMRNW